MDGLTQGEGRSFGSGTGDAHFEEKIEEVIENNALGISVALGHRLGLFEAMIDCEEPVKSSELASKAGLNERYVREWLAIMVTSKVFMVDKEKGTYFLPRDRVTYFQNKKSRFFFEKFFIMFPPILKQLEECFVQGGGIPYSNYQRFHEVTDGIAVEWHQQHMLKDVVPSIKGLHQKLASGIVCLDVGCGMGCPNIILAKEYPQSEQYGFDISESCISNAKEKAKKEGLSNVHFKVKDCAVFDPSFEEFFDYISAHSAIHDQAKPNDALRCIYKMLKKGGTISVIDVNAHSHPADNINLPNSTMKYAISLLHCMPVSLYFDGAGLGACWGKELAVEMLKDAGFIDISVRTFAWDSSKIHYVARK